jgi:hypothetical protein
VQRPTMKFVATKTAEPRIFEKFAQADATEAQKGGTGLGLVGKGLWRRRRNSTRKNQSTLRPRSGKI